uniref:Uncharacterized protein n=1 Tax=Timspurckia oligopyrenoides TaxID=708627 RepID=A0A7S1EQH1_9RHOD|mmetsp:Transcript_12843/g.23099  ORF Transcript_12843/g.23099 Transcript_12843/m.23099 type:complete len:279 (+) Transcript_12843:57-893(+)
MMSLSVGFQAGGVFVLPSVGVGSNLSATQSTVKFRSASKSRSISSGIYELNYGTKKVTIRGQTLNAEPSSTDVSGDSEAASVKAGDVVLIARSFGEFRAGLIDSVDSSCTTADVILLELFQGSFYIRDQSSAREFARVKDMVPLKNAKAVLDGFSIPDASFSEAEKQLTEGKKQVSAERNQEKVIPKEKPKTSVVSKRSAVIAAALSVPLSAIFYAFHKSMVDTYAQTAPASSQEQLSQKILLALTFGASALTEFAGISLLLWAIISPAPSSDASSTD